MSQEERYGDRDQSYSAWHRRKSTARYVGLDGAHLLAMIDLDACPYIEYHDSTKEPLALIEVAMDVGQSNKPSTVTKNLAKRSGLPALVVLYRLSEDTNPSDANFKDIDRFRIKRIHPTPQSDWCEKSPEEYAEILLRMRKYSGNQILAKEFPDA